MTFYYGLRSKNVTAEERVRTVEGLERLRAQIATSIPKRTVSDTLLVATWNIRDLGNENKRSGADAGPGERFLESYYYIAEVISAFDLVALQEVNTLESLQKIMRYLGPSWDYLTTDTKRGAGGNQERMTFVFDKRKVLFKHVTGQIVVDTDQQFARTPFYAAFQAGWFKFTLCTVHILYGDWKDTTKRVKEIDRIAGFLTDRSKSTGENILLLGDFNILNRNDATFKPLEKHGWFMPLDFDTNVMHTKAYDQIAFYVDEDDLPEVKGGVLDYFQSVFRDNECETYFDEAKALGRPMEPWDNTEGWPDKTKILKREEYYRQWRTWQISDHMPLWAEVNIDFTDSYLKKTKAWKSK
ncbi:endonuclease/exonuclease/phosphatase family protein [Planctomycetota bacterium]|nr:endonuclease/exonuclease/phosphatase family protein [Planctomycetota bacterium]